MAKLKAPLLSFGASGALGKAIVFFPWKGIDAVREYVVPANPRSAAQVAQRLHMTNAMTEFHGADYTADDMTAWNKLAGVAAKIMSGANRMIKEFIDEAILGNTWERIYQVTTSLIGANNFDVHVFKAEGGNVPTIHYGTRKTHFPDSQGIGADGVDQWTTTIAGLLANTLYYFYIDVGTSETDYGRTGIYQVRTTA